MASAKQRIQCLKEWKIYLDKLRERKKKGWK